MRQWLIWKSAGRSATLSFQVPGQTGLVEREYDIARRDPGAWVSSRSRSNYPHDHNDVIDTALVPASQPANTPFPESRTQFHRMAKTEEFRLGLNSASLAHGLPTYS